KRKGRLGEGRPLQVNHTKGASESGELPTDPMTAASMKIRQSPVVPRHRATGRFGLRPKRGKLKWLKDSSSALRFEHVCPTVNSTDEAAAHHFRRSRPGSGRSDDSRGPCPGRQGDVADRRWLVCASDRVGVPIANVLDQRLLQEREIARGWSVPEDG